MGMTVMSKWENVRLQGIQMFAYFITRFNMTPDEAVAEMMAKELNKNNETIIERK